jgi:hypothetical protein
MKKANSNGTDELRSEYKRSDLGRLIRGKYANRAARETNVIVLEPDIAKAFPNDAAVNSALRGLLNLAKTAARPTERDKKRRVG